MHVSGRVSALLVISALVLAPRGVGQRRRVDSNASGWIEENLERGVERARATGKPLMVVFRCPP